MENLFKKIESNSNFFIGQLNAAQNLFAGFVKYNNDFIIPYLTSTAYFSRAELSKLDKDSPGKQWDAYADLLKFNLDLLSRYFSGSMQAIDDFNNKELENYLQKKQILF